MFALKQQIHFKGKQLGLELKMAPDLTNKVLNFRYSFFKLIFSLIICPFCSNIFAPDFILF